MLVQGKGRTLPHLISHRLQDCASVVLCFHTVYPSAAHRIANILALIARRACIIYVLQSCPPSKEGKPVLLHEAYIACWFCPPHLTAVSLLIQLRCSHYKRCMGLILIVAFHPHLQTPMCYRSICTQAQHPRSGPGCSADNVQHKLCCMSSWLRGHGSRTVLLVAMAFVSCATGH